MLVCNICIDDLKEPVCLPCGHVFCGSCIVRTVNTIKPATSLQPCPTCRRLYSIINVDPSTIPPPIRPHLVPSIRKLYLGDTHVKPVVADVASTAASAAVSECGRLAAENKTLRVNCAVWKRRAELHAAATLGLLNLARLARDCNQQLKNERDDLQRQCNLMKRKLEAEEAFSMSEPVVLSDKLAHTVPSTYTMKSAPRDSENTGFPPAVYAPCRRMSVSRASSAPAIMIPHPYAEPPEQNLLPSLKRRKVDETTLPPCSTLSACVTDADISCIKLEADSTSPQLHSRKRKELMV
ncbi:hypothetical protein F5878DRAFT_41596 [Lentinula raphanica]|uniref:RING-type domain-containing protein n=1 Tax=Lentinula raphanica TaxID=153919 RepID=A0AA38PEB9_9AGAR|nr:hypothetical protein F5880DRAFT_848201 [Lentinula raphanica]KAJ3840996.1 hypothetical protein F5878DRAFT_41596 [Lentinula raphanica]